MTALITPAPTSSNFRRSRAQLPPISAVNSPYLQPQQIFVLYDYDSNAILTARTELRMATDMISACNMCYNKVLNAGITLKLQYLDNEVSNALIRSIKNKNLAYHRLNPAKHAVQTF